MAKLKNIYISSIHQNAGKTTLSLGLFKLFQEKGLKTAFMKPVGQQTVTVDEHTVDKDTFLIGEVYSCRSKIKDMSPVTIGHGFTEKYIANPSNEELKGKIEKSFKSLSKGQDAIIIEGTGHAGVGSVIDLSNADVAAMLGSKAIIVSEGGIGKSIDEIALNKALFDLKNVEILGVVINKVIPEKFDRIKKVLHQGLKHKGIRLLGVIPMDPVLRFPSIEQVATRLKLKVLVGEGDMDRYVHNTIVAAMEPHNMIKYLKDSTLLLTSGDRVDNIMVALSSHLMSTGKKTPVSGMILTGGLAPDEKILAMLKKSGIPVLYTEDDTYTIAGKIENLICKIQNTEKDKIAEALELVKSHVDVEAILNNL